jgi:SAM-dependent methyltransferase
MIFTGLLNSKLSANNKGQDMELTPRLYHWFVRPDWFTKILNSKIEGIIKSKYDFHNKAILDFGSGIGTSCTIFAPQDYIGLDCDLRRVCYARRLYSGYKFSLLEGEHLPLGNASIDCILITSVLHHIPEDKLTCYLNEFLRILKPNGVVLIIEPCFLKGCHFCNIFMKLLDKGRYIRDEAGYIKKFEDLKFRVEVHMHYRQMLFYNKLFFSADPK